jgi:hypothetical protein
MGLVTATSPASDGRKWSAAQRPLPGGLRGDGEGCATLLRLAIRQARPRGFARARHCLIGDTPRDIQAAQANGVLAVAVATGLCSMEELAVASPDVLVEDLRGLPPGVLFEPPGGSHEPD